MSITLDGSNVSTVGVINSGTAVASTSGTAIDFTGIPAGVKRITVMFSGVSLSGTAHFLVQIGSGSISSSGYNSSSGYAQATNIASNATSTAGFVAFANQGVNVFSGSIVLTLFSSTVWVESHALGLHGAGGASGGGQSPSLSGTLDRVRITTTNGTDTFDAGSINILYE